jgi:transposase-like protein
MAGRKIRDAHDARSCVDAAESSGVARAEWAREHGIDGRSLHAWHMNLARRASEPTPLPLVELVPSAPSAATPCVRVRCGRPRPARSVDAVRADGQTPVIFSMISRLCQGLGSLSTTSPRLAT